MRELKSMQFWRSPRSRAARRFVFLVTASLAWAQAAHVEIRNNEVWLNRGGAGKQLTRDGRSKLQAVLSRAGDRIAYYEQCIEGERCTPSVVILDLEGNRLQTFQPTIKTLGQPEPCASILGISWEYSDPADGPGAVGYSWVRAKALLLSSPMPVARSRDVSRVLMLSGHVRYGRASTLLGSGAFRRVSPDDAEARASGASNTHGAAPGECYDNFPIALRRSLRSSMS